VVIRLSGEVIKRKKKLSKKYYGTSHAEAVSCSLQDDDVYFQIAVGATDRMISPFLLSAAIQLTVPLSPKLPARRTRRRSIKAIDVSATPPTSSRP